MQVTLPPEIEAIAEQAAKEGGYGNIAEFIAEAVRQSVLGESVQRELGARESTPSYSLPYADWKKRFEEFLAHRKATNPHFDDSRESIYLNRS